MARGIEFRGFSNARIEDQHSIHLGEDGNENALQLHHRRDVSTSGKVSIELFNEFLPCTWWKFTLYTDICNKFIKLIDLSPRGLARINSFASSPLKTFHHFLKRWKANPFSRGRIRVGSSFQGRWTSAHMRVPPPRGSKDECFQKNRSPRIHPTLCETRTSRDD